MHIHACKKISNDQDAWHAGMQHAGATTEQMMQINDKPLELWFSERLFNSAVCTVVEAKTADK